MPEREAVELFLQEASEHLQYLREYVSVLQEISPRRGEGSISLKVWGGPCASSFASGR